MNFKEHEGIIFNYLVQWIFVSKLIDELMWLKSAPNLHLNYYRQYIRFRVLLHNVSFYGYVQTFSCFWGSSI